MPDYSMEVTLGSPQLHQQAIYSGMCSQVAKVLGMGPLTNCLRTSLAQLGEVHHQAGHGVINVEATVTSKRSG